MTTGVSTIRSLILIVLLGTAAAGRASELYRYEVTFHPDAAYEVREIAAQLARQYDVSLHVAGETMVMEVSEAVARTIGMDRRVATVGRLRATVHASGTWQSGQYSYDGAGNIEAIGTDRYVYDAVGRLVSGTAAKGTRKQTYAYDAFGNLTEMQTVVGGVTTNTRTLDVDPQTNRIRSSGGGNVVATYDVAGNETSVNSGPLRKYDPLNVMVTNGGDTFYIYTADDERIAVSNLAGTHRTWTLRGTDQKVLREYTETVTAGVRQWKWNRDYTYRDGMLLGAYVNDADADRAIQHYHLDHLGTPRFITNRIAVRLAEDENYPFGEDVEFNVNDAERLHFTGHERDYNGGTAIANSDYLDYMHARHYTPTLGRFVSVDPTMDSANVAVPQTWNRYSYALNNPVLSIDPDGEVAWIAVGAGVGTLVGAGANFFTQVAEKGFNNVNYRDVGAAAVGGFVSGGIAGMTGGASLFIAAPVSVAGNVAGGMVSRELDSTSSTNATDGKAVTMDAVAGAVGVGAGVVLEKGVKAAAGPTVAAAEKQIAASTAGARQGNYGAAQSVLGHANKIARAEATARVVGTVGGEHATQATPIIRDKLKTKGQQQ